MKKFIFVPINTGNWIVKILVALSISSDIYSDIRVDRETDAVRISSDLLSINPLDKQILAKALSTGAEVSAVCVCPAEGERALRYALAMGARTVSRINNCPLDAYAASKEVSTFLKDHPADVVLCGQAGWDYASGEFPKYLSEEAEIGLVEDVSDFSVSGDELYVVRQTDVRQMRLRVKTPVILACTKAIYPEEQIRIPSMREMMMSLRPPLPVREGNGAILPIRAYRDYRAMPPRDTVRFFPSDDYAALAGVLQNALADGGENVENEEVSLFSGRVLSVTENDRIPIGLPAQTEMLEQEQLPVHKDLHTAPVVISGGMGVSPQAWKTIEDLADITGSAIGCTRPVYQSGVRPYFEHVGQTGAKVAPRLYVAAGISGALQHIAGMIRSGKILAINTDPHAEIFKYADYGVVGDAGQVLSGICEVLRSTSGK